MFGTFPLKQQQQWLRLKNAQEVYQLEHNEEKQ